MSTLASAPDVYNRMYGTEKAVSSVTREASTPSPSLIGQIP